MAALSMSARAVAQPAQPPTPTPAPGEPTTPTEPTTPRDNNAEQGAQPVSTPPAPPVAPPPPAAPSKVSYPSMEGAALRYSDLFSIRPGMLLQFWGALSQDSLPKADGSSGDFSKNMYLRRARFYMLGGIGKDITWFLLMETGNLGLATLNADGTVNRNYTTFNWNDAWLSYKVNNYLSFQAGLMLIPFTRNILQSTGTYWTIDIGGVSASYIAATQTSTLRDTGVQVKVNAADGHLELRGMVAQGVRIADPAGMGRAPGKNDPRLTAFAQYNFLDTEAGYVFNGQYFGKKKMAGIAVGADYQSISSDNPYFATSATAFAAIPIKGASPAGGDEVGGQVEYLHFHGGRAAPASGLGKQNALLVELGYYNKEAKLSLFGKFEGRFFDGTGADVNNTRLFGGGLKYFFAEAIANVTLQYNFAQTPNIPSTMRNSTNQLLLQLQLAYF
jgi:hypothetical protein